MRIALTADHNGVQVKARLTTWLAAHGHEAVDLGVHDPHEVVDYPPLCADLCRRVVTGEVERGVVVGGSGSGETIACNKVRGVRATLCHSTWGAEIARGNNDSNVLVLGAKVVAPELAEQLLATWLATPFRGGVHARRLEQIAAIERGEPLGADPGQERPATRATTAPGSSGATSPVQATNWSGRTSTSRQP